MYDTWERPDGATKAEIVIVFVAVSAIIGFSYFTAHHAAAPAVLKQVTRNAIIPSLIERRLADALEAIIPEVVE